MISPSGFAPVFFAQGIYWTSRPEIASSGPVLTSAYTHERKAAIRHILAIIRASPTSAFGRKQTPDY
jgi:hypothetical protein